MNPNLVKQLVFNAASTATLLFPVADTSLPEALFRNCHNMLMLRLVRAVRELSKCAARIITETQFLAAFESLCSCSSQTQARIMAYPSLAFWIDVTEDLLRREMHIRFPDAHFARHIQEFWRFALAAAVLDETERCCCKIASNGSGFVALPGTATVLSCALAGYESLDCVVSRGRFSSLTKKGSAKVIEPRINQIPVVLDGSVELNFVDEDFQLPGRTAYVYESIRSEDLPRWLSALADAWNMLADSCPPLTKELPLGVQALVPVVGGGAETHSSASFSEAPGLIALSWHPDPVVLAEALVHEYHHQKLNSLQIIDPLILGPSSALYYSPWRPDPRPLTGILHGVYVFQAVLQWWDRLSPARFPTLTAQRIAARKYVLYRQLQSAIDTLMSNAKITPLGKWLCAGICKIVEEYASRMTEINLRDRDAIEGALKKHQVQWNQANHHPCRPSKRLDDSGTSVGVGEGDLNLLQLLGLDSNEQGCVLSAIVSTEEVLLERVSQFSEQDTTQQLRMALGPYSDSESALRSTIRGHLAYTARDFQAAARYYSVALSKTPSSKHLWQSFAFTFRHIGRWSDSAVILSNISMLSEQSLNLEFGAQTNPEEILGVALSEISRHEIALSQ